MRKIMFCIAALAAGGSFGESLGTIDRNSDQSGFTWDVANTPFTSSVGALWQNGYTARFSMWGGNKGYPVRVSSTPNGMVEMYGLQIAAGNWAFYGDPFKIGPGGIQMITTATDAFNATNTLILTASQTWLRTAISANFRVSSDIVADTGVTPDLTLDSAYSGGRFDFQGTATSAGATTLKNGSVLYLYADSKPGTAKMPTGPLTIEDGGFVYVSGNGVYTQAIDGLTLKGIFGGRMFTVSGDFAFDMKRIARDAVTSPYATLNINRNSKWRLSEMANTSFLGAWASGEGGWLRVDANGWVQSTYGGAQTDLAKWTDPTAHVNMDAPTVSQLSGLSLTNATLRFGASPALDLRGSRLALAQGGTMVHNYASGLSNGFVRSLAPSGALFTLLHQDLTIQAVIEDDEAAGPTTLVKAGRSDRTLSLAGQNTYSGGTYINEGYVKVVTGGKLGSGDVFVIPSYNAGSYPAYLWFNNSDVSRNVVRNLFCPAAAVKAAGSGQVDLTVEGWTTNMVFESSAGIFDIDLKGPAKVGTFRCSGGRMNVHGGNPVLTADLIEVNSATGVMDLDSPLAAPVICNAYIRQGSDSGTIRFSGGTWQMRSGDDGNANNMRGRTEITNAVLIFNNGGRNMNGDIFIRNGGTVYTRNNSAFRFVNERGTSGRSYGLNIYPGGALIMQFDGLYAGGIDGTAVTVNQFGGFVSTTNHTAGRKILLNTSAAASAPTTYNLSGGTLLVQDYVASEGASATSVFNFTGGVLATREFRTAGFASRKLLNAGGVVAPGDIGTVGNTVVLGDFETTAAGALAIDISGTTPATSFKESAFGRHDTVTVSAGSKVVLGGRLDVTLRDGFKPSNGEAFTLLAINAGTGNELGGTFANLMDGKVLTTDGQYVFNVTIDPAAYTVTLSDAQPNVWTGAAGDGNWTTPGNWSGGVAPSGSSTVASLDSISADNQIALGETLALGGLVFDSTAGRYTLSGTDALSLGGLTVLSGQHTLDVPVTLADGAVIQVDTVCPNAGLSFGRLDGDRSAAPNPQTSVETALTWAYTTVSTASLTNTPWLAPVSQLIYSGYIWNNDVTNVTWSFAIKYDDFALLKLNGVQLYDVGWNTFAKTNAVLSPGANSFELRLGNYSSGAGPLDGFGPVYDPQGRLSSSASDYIQFAEAGQGQLFTTTNTRTMLEGQALFTKAVTASNVIKNGAGVVTFAVGADLQQLTLNAGRVSFAGELTIHNGVVRTAGTLDFAASTAVLRLQKVAGITVSAVEGWIADGWFSIQGKTVADERFYSVKDTGDGYITVRLQKVGTRIILR